MGGELGGRPPPILVVEESNPPPSPPTHRPAPPPCGRPQVSAMKGGASLLAAGCLVLGGLTPMEQRYLQYLGLGFQLLDDLQDVQDDLRERRCTAQAETPHFLMFWGFRHFKKMFKTFKKLRILTLFSNKNQRFLNNSGLVSGFGCLQNPRKISAPYCFEVGRGSNSPRRCWEGSPPPCQGFSYIPTPLAFADLALALGVSRSLGSSAHARIVPPPPP